MKTNIKSRVSLEGKKGIFFSSGLIMVMSLALLAFEWGKRDYRIVIPDNLGEEIVLLDEKVQNTAQEKPEVQKKQEVFNIIIAPDPGFTNDDWDLWFPEDDWKTKLQPYVPPKDVEGSDSDDLVDIIFIPIADWPSFPGGDVAMAKFLSENMHYPKIAVQEGIQGSVHVMFVVEKDGSITNVELLKDIGGGCGDEAVRVIKMMPKWNPGKQRNHAVKVKMRMPVKFKLAS